MRRSALTLALPLLLTATAAAPADGPMIAHLQSAIDHDDAYALVKTLSSWEYEGRMTGQPGQHMTADLAAKHFEQLGLAPAGDPGSFYQRFPLATNKIHAASLSVGDKAFEFGPDFISRGDGGSGDVTAQAVFVGRGISDPEQDFDEYAGIDATGKIVVALRGGHPEVEGDWGLTGWKVRAAKAHGAIGLVLLGAQADGSFEGLIGSVYFSNGDIPWDPDFPAVQGNASVAKALFADSGYSLPELIRLSDEDRIPVSTDLGTEVHLTVDTTMDLAASTENVVGMLEGSDPKLKHEVIVVGGHMDHVGLQGEDLLFCGQEDNASGSTAVMELAEAFATAPSRPKRSILFMLYTGEEMGLLGSHYWLDHPTIERSRVKAMLNFDMPGQGNTFMAHNGANTPQIDALNKQANAKLHQLEYSTTDSAAASDHASFWFEGIPAVMYLNGGDRKYPVHQLGEWKEDGLNWELWEKVTETSGLALKYLANAPKVTDRGAPEEQLLAHVHDHGESQYHACY